MVNNQRQCFFPPTLGLHELGQVPGAFDQERRGRAVKRAGHDEFGDFALPCLKGVQREIQPCVLHVEPTAKAKSAVSSFAMVLHNAVMTLSLQMAMLIPLVCLGLTVIYQQN